jgi:exonuclease 3'-5' domain-containing protein 1
MGAAPDYVLCADKDALHDVIETIQSSPVIILDCEGDDLGQKGGSLSLISIKVTETDGCGYYLIDAISISKDDLQPLFDILASSSTTKVLFDGRMDFAELYHTYGVTLRGVLDLQLADVASRSTEGEDEDAQLARLSPFLHRREVSSQNSSYTQVHMLSGLDKCIAERKLAEVGGKSKTGGESA